MAKLQGQVFKKGHAFGAELSKLCIPFKSRVLHITEVGWHFSVEHFLAEGKQALQPTQSMGEAIWPVNLWHVCTCLDGRN